MHIKMNGYLARFMIKINFKPRICIKENLGVKMVIYMLTINEYLQGDELFGGVWISEWHEWWVMKV